MIPVQYNIRSLAVRKATTFATGLGIALVVFVFAAALMLSAGIKKTLKVSGRDDVVLVMRKGSDNELSSNLEDTQLSLLKATQGVKVRADGSPKGSGEVVMINGLEKVGAEGISNVQLRGLTEDGVQLRASMKVVAGRAPKPGADEAMVGTRIRGRFKGTELGQKIEVKKGRAIEVVGVFEDGGSSYESEVWMDLEVLRTSYARQGSISSVRLELESASRFEGARAAIESDKRLGLLAMRESEYFEKQSEGTSLFINVLGTLIALFFSIGAMIGAMITMYSSIANRQKEIGTLRALGFSKSAILFSFLLESVVLSLAGGMVGLFGAILLGTVKFSMLNFASFSEMTFGFEPTPQVLVTALAFSAFMGLLGGFLPALRASRVSPILAMRGAA